MPSRRDPGSEADFDALARCRSRAGCDDYALFEALSAEQGGAPWWRWPAPLRDRDADALAAAEQRLAAALARAGARAVALRRAVARAARARRRARHPHLRRPAHLRGAGFSGHLDHRPGSSSSTPTAAPRAVAGVPPDYFAADGQLWGNPLYDWDAQQRDGFSFWLQRLALQADRFDLLRIDHFRALEAYWSVPAGATTAREGEWRKAPGDELLRSASPAHLPQLELVAEDLGVITPEVTALRRSFGLPGMRVLQFGFDGDPANLHLPHEHETDSIVYTGTHDNDTTAGWYAALDAARRAIWCAATWVAVTTKCVDAMLRAALGFGGRLAVLPMQDLLHLGSEARLNRPGTVTGNWSWRLPLESLTRRTRRAVP